ncbi:MAG: MaoC family dehydratase [Candidatus Eremiobacteraeota bacterium]|nr:MaoC family dehydratase [Candidatus Eremiobacteraeota bacterium]
MDFTEGQSASLTHKVTAADVEAFAKVTGDTNPVHLDEAYAADTRFGRRIAHGMLAVSYISAILGTKFPGPGTIYLSQSVSFLAPVYIGDEITATVTVSKYRAEKGVLTLLTECWNQSGVKVVDGQAVVLVTDVAAAQPTLQAQPVPARRPAPQADPTQADQTSESAA